MKTPSLQALDALAVVATLAGLAPVVDSFFTGTRPSSTGAMLTSAGSHWFEGFPVGFLLFALFLAVGAFTQYVTSPDTPQARWKDCVPLETWVGFAGAAFFTWLLTASEVPHGDLSYQLTAFFLVVALAFHSLQVTQWVALNLLRYMVNLAFPGAYEAASAATTAQPKDPL
ncbi:hypothetical protein LC612_35360 [Nostoc sp. CHAB 5834]|nr:hypothetical protein [Nostoc sp. CHAB 5834]